jgi:hypothetical protein
MRTIMSLEGEFHIRLSYVQIHKMDCALLELVGWI